MSNLKLLQGQLSFFCILSFLPFLFVDQSDVVYIDLAAFLLVIRGCLGEMDSRLEVESVTHAQVLILFDISDGLPCLLKL